jgi:hypothetical protein
MGKPSAAWTVRAIWSMAKALIVLDDAMARDASSVPV